MSHDLTEECPNLSGAAADLYDAAYSALLFTQWVNGIDLRDPETRKEVTRWADRLEEKLCIARAKARGEIA